jgi:hypothetical protein
LPVLSLTGIAASRDSWSRFPLESHTTPGFTVPVPAERSHGLAFSPRASNEMLLDSALAQPLTLDARASRAEGDAQS